MDKQASEHSHTVERGSASSGSGALLLYIGFPVFFLVFLFTPNRPVQFITLFLVILILASKAYSEYLVTHLRLIRCDRELRSFRYEWTDVELYVENKGYLPAFLLVITDASGGIAVFRNIKCLCTLRGRKRRHICRQLIKWKAYGSSRGVFTLGPATLRGSDPLGLFPFTIRCGETSKLFVYPAPAFAAVKSPGGIPLGNLLASDPFNEDLTRPRSLREYHPGDESRRINWKASAKNAGLLVNEYEFSLSYPLVIFLNVDVREYSRPLDTLHTAGAAIKSRELYRELYIERIIEAAAALCLMAARERQVLGLIIHTAEAKRQQEAATVSAAISPAAFALIPVLECLSALEPFKIDNSSGNDSPPGDESAQDQAQGPALRASTRLLLEKGKTMSFGTRLIYAGPSLPEDDYNALESLRRRRLSLEYLIIDEKNLGFLRGSGKYQIKETGYVLV